MLFQVNSAGLVTTPALSPSGLTGATAASRYVGGTNSGAPASGTFAVGDYVIDQTGKIWICTAAGTPGTWTAGTGVTVDNTTIPQKDATVGTAGNSAQAAPANHAHPRTGWTSDDHGLVTWSMDVAAAGFNSLLSVAGTLYVVRLHVPVSANATNILLAITSAGVTLTSGQCFAGLYTSAGSLVATTADQASNWQSTGLKTMALTGGPFALTAGDYYVGFYANGTTLPAFVRGNNQIGGSLLNVGIGSGFRFATANTGLTTALPGALSAQTSSNFAWWVAVS